MVSSYRNNAGRLGAGFISVCLETRWLGQNRGFYEPEPPCTMEHSSLPKCPPSKARAWDEGTQDEYGQSLVGDGTFLKIRSFGKATSKCWLQLFRKRRNKQKSWRKLDTDHQRGQYYEHYSRSIVPRELKERQRCLPLLSFSRRGEEIYSFGETKKDQQ